MNSKENYLLIDHRAYNGELFEAATYTCRHCCGVIIKNPLRERERAYCPKCDGYICDSCEAIRHEPGYQHMPWKEVVDLVRNGDAVVLPESTHGRPKLLFIR